MRRLLVTLFFIPACATAQNARLDNADAEPRIVVTATKSARVAPDRVTIYFSIEGTGESTAEAIQKATQKLQAVTSALRPLTTADGMTQIPYGVAPASNRNSFPGTSGQPSYVARYAVRLQPKSLDQITQVASAAISAGASNMSPPMFESLAVDSVRRNKYAEALAQARRDAEALAAALGGKLGTIIDVSTAGSLPTFSQQQAMIFASNYEYSGASPSPDVFVNATVTVRYRFIPPGNN
jgi:uncharacterized protein YggE